MSLTLADGSVLSIAATYGATKSMTAITNATEAVATLEASHGVIVGDIFEVTSGWLDLNGRIVRAKTVATNDVTFESIDTSSTTLYPAGEGIGSIREIATWQTVSQVLSIASEGGDQQFYEYQFMNALLRSRVPTNKDPVTVALEIADDIAATQNTHIKASDTTQTVRAARLVYRNASRTLFNGYWSYGPFPMLALGQANKRAVKIALSAAPTEYST